MSDCAVVHTQSSRLLKNRPVSIIIFEIKEETMLSARLPLRLKQEEKKKKKKVMAKQKKGENHQSPC